MAPKHGLHLCENSNFSYFRTQEDQALLAKNECRTESSKTRINQMSIDKSTYTSPTLPTIYLEEHNIYGSSRVGSERLSMSLAYVKLISPSTPSASNYIAENEIGDKRFELSNHLGNVLQVISDRKLATEGTGGGAGTIDYFTADVVNYSDYYPYGMIMTGDKLKQGATHNGTASNYVDAHGSDAGYRYGYNGMEKDDEIKGNGNSYDFGARLLDPRVGRWLTIDPMAGKQAGQSPYKSMLNNPILWVDPDGNTEYETIIFKSAETGKVILKTYTKISNKYMTDGIQHEYLGGTVTIQYGYDYRHVTYITVDADGNQRLEGQATEVLDGNPIRGFVIGGEYEPGTIFTPKAKSDPFMQEGGWYMTGENGQGTKYKAKNTEYVGNIDLLLAAIDRMTKAGKSGQIIQDKGTKELVKSLIEREAGLIERWQQITDEWKEGNSGGTGGDVAIDDSVETRNEFLDKNMNIEKVVITKQERESHYRGDPADEGNSRTYVEEKGGK